MASADFSAAVAAGRPVATRRARAAEISQGKTMLFPPTTAGFTCHCVRMTIGRPRPVPGYPAWPALYPVSVRRLRVLPSGFLQTPPRGDALAFG